MILRIYESAMKRTFKITISAKNPITERTLTFDLTEEQYHSPMFIKHLIDAQDELIKETIEASIKEIIEVV